MSFSLLAERPSDPLLKLIGLFAIDPRPERLDLGVGVYKTRSGETPVMVSVKSAERHLVTTQASKSYLGPEGDMDFVRLLERVALAGAIDADRLAGLQTPGGTGALRLGADLLKASGVQRVWIGRPSWANHAPIFSAAGLTPMLHDMFDMTEQVIDLAVMDAALNETSPGDAILLHGCCHNPTGIDPDAAGWAFLAERIAACSLIPFVDLAYQGLGIDLERDAAGARALLARVPAGLLAYSCDKNFGLYRERTGALWAIGEGKAQRDVLFSNLLSLARANWSMPPDHGAAVVRTILQDAALRASWRVELAGMCQHLRALRTDLAALGRIGALDLSTVERGHGMFTTLALDAAQIDWLQRERAIYMAGSGRISIAGLGTSAGVARFGAALAALPEAGR